MEQTLSFLHPNPGWTKTNDENTLCSKDVSSEVLLGKHCILELYECDPVKINDEEFIRKTITSASKISGAKLLNMITHSFYPQGVTGLALLAESHISIHTWPEARYAAIDVFTCGGTTMPEKACMALVKEFKAKDHSLKSFRRETPTQVAHISREAN